eukprot:gnl/TRDRNA2_/TRDRNA2_188434_c0_seq1.p1 gnl/TRDRNA2_/TRDRNA2_188434_c0~~gnl/TRDRNA2_/TRDRNA2_188434_c0_seq1.p1  ORF type:complete len:107 (+),score=15.75 gnl/TRDRNA2_/TRDRNA2_188434_c0_seq1:122-442(+)
MVCTLRCLGLCILLIFAAISLHGCGGCDKGVAKECAEDAVAVLDASNMCPGVQKSFDCMKDCCEEQASDVTAECPNCGDMSVKDYIARGIESRKENECSSLKSPCS